MLDCASVDLALVQPSDARSDWSGMGKKERKKKKGGRKRKINGKKGGKGKGRKEESDASERTAERIAGGYTTSFWLRSGRL